jgi:CheY-like chemotaxis protein
MTLPNSQKSILFVDDEPAVRSAMTLLLGVGGFVVEAAASGQEALTRLETKIFDLVMTDNFMLGMSGTELALAIKTRWPSLPIVMFTGYPPGEPAPSLDLVLIKPGNGLDLLDAVKGILCGKEGS